MNEQGKMTMAIDKKLVESIKAIVGSARKSISQKINHELVLTYWRIGEEIVNTENVNNLDNKTSRQIILNLSKLLTQKSEKAFRVRISSICESFTRNTQMSRQCLDT